MSSWTNKDLEYWDDKISEIAKSYGLDWFPINYDICDYYEMIGHMSYGGMPSHYHHWSYGKSFERTHQFYNLGLEGLPYELIINSNPSIAYLMRENPLFLQILIMAHCVGHSDFFKHNRMFENTRPDSVVSKFRNAKNRIKSYIENPNIGIDQVERFLDSLHSIKYQTERYGRERIPHETLKSQKIDSINSKSEKESRFFDIDKVPVEKDYDLLGFFIEHGKFTEWERDLIEIVRDESLYFIPQIRTKIMNEGWASFWHYKIMNDLSLEENFHIPFLRTHNQVIRPHVGGLNPYHLGFHIFEKLYKEKGLEFCFNVREIHHDESAIRCFLEREDFEELNLFSYSSKKDKVSIDEISSEKGWEAVRQDLIKGTGINQIPHIYVEEITPGGELILYHDHDGRDLDLAYCEKVVDHISYIWNANVKFFTIIEGESWEI